MAKKRERFHAAWWEIRDDDEGDGPYWEGCGEGDKEGTRMSDGEALMMSPSHFPVGTRVDVSEPEDPAFYEKLCEVRPVPIHTLADDLRRARSQRDLLLITAERAERLLSTFVSPWVGSGPGSTLAQLRAAIAEVREP